MKNLFYTRAYTSAILWAVFLRMVRQIQPCFIKNIPEIVAVHAGVA